MSFSNGYSFKLGANNIRNANRSPSIKHLDDVQNDSNGALSIGDMIKEEMEPRLMTERYVAKGAPYIRNMTSDLITDWEPWWVGIGYFINAIFTTGLMIFFQALAYIIFPGSMAVNNIVRSIIIGGTVYFLKSTLGRWSTAYVDPFRSMAATATFIFSKDDRIGKPNIWWELLKLLILIVGQFAGSIIAMAFINVVLGGPATTRDCILNPAIVCGAYPILDNSEITTSTAHWLEAIGAMLIYGTYIFTEREFGFKWISSTDHASRAVAVAHALVHAAFGSLSGGSFNFWYFLSTGIFSNNFSNASVYTWPALVGILIVLVFDIIIFYIRRRYIKSNTSVNGDDDNQDYDENDYVMVNINDTVENKRPFVNSRMCTPCKSDNNKPLIEDDGVYSAFPGHVVPHIRNCTTKLFTDWELWSGTAYLLLELIGVMLFIFFQAFAYIKYPGQLSGNPVTRSWIVGLVILWVRFLIGRYTTAYLCIFRTTAATFTFLLSRDRRLGSPSIWYELLKWLVIVVFQFAGAIAGVVLLKLVLSGDFITSDCGLDFIPLCDARPVINTLTTTVTRAHWMEAFAGILIYASMIWGERSFGFFLLRSSWRSAVFVASAHLTVHLVFGVFSGGVFNFWYFLVIGIFTGDFSNASVYTWPGIVANFIVFVLDIIIYHLTKWMIKKRKEREEDLRYRE